MREIAIVGGGPAGAMCGERLARSGHRVTIYDEHLAWEKPCGGGLTFGSFHSQELDSFFLAMPGIKALYPSTPQDAFNALLALGVGALQVLLDNAVLVPFLDYGQGTGEQLIIHNFCG